MQAYLRAVAGHAGRTVRLLGLPEIVILVEGLDVVAAASLEQRSAGLRESTRGPPGLAPAQPGCLPETPRTHAVVISVDAEADLRNPVKRGAAGTQARILESVAIPFSRGSS